MYIDKVKLYIIYINDLTFWSSNLIIKLILKIIIERLNINLEKDIDIFNKKLIKVLESYLFI